MVRSSIFDLPSRGSEALNALPDANGKAGLRFDGLQNAPISRTIAATIITAME
jgi:hypothetical protein